MQNNIANLADSALTKKKSMQALIAAMLLMLTWTGAGWNALGTYSVFVVEDLGLTTAQFATNFTILSGMNTVISLTVYGFFMGKFGTRRMIFFGGIFCSAGFALFGMASSAVTMWGAAVVFGIGISFININTFNVMVTTWFKKNTAKWTGFGQAFGPVSGAFFNSIWGITMIIIGWRLPFFISAAFSLVMTFLVYGLYKNDPHEEGCKARGELELEAEMAAKAGTDEDVDILTGPTFQESLRMPATWLCFIGYALAGVCDYGILGNYALIAADYGYGEQAGLIMGFSWAAQAISFVALGWICDKWGSRHAVIFCFILVVIVCVYYLMFDVSLVMIYVCGALVGFADGAVQMPMGATAREVLGTRDFAKKMGLVGGGCYLGVTFAAVIVASIFDATGSYDPAFMLLIGLSIVSGIIFWVVAKRRY